MPAPIHGPDPLRIVPLIPGQALPCHREPAWVGDVVVRETRTYPVGKIAGRYWCKYCYQTHTSWWMMDQRDYQVDGLLIILCEPCGHTTGIGTDGDQTWYASGAFDEELQDVNDEEGE